MRRRRDGTAQCLPLGLEQQGVEKCMAGVFIGLVRRAPTAQQLGLAQSLALPLPQAFGVLAQGRQVIGCEAQRPTAEQGLVKYQFVACRGGRRIIAQGCRLLAPLLDPADIGGAAFTQYGQPCAAVLTALVVMGGGGQQVVGKGLQALLIGLMEIFHGCTELFGAKAHVVA